MGDGASAVSWRFLRRDHMHVGSTAFRAQNYLGSMLAGQLEQEPYSAPAVGLTLEL